MHELGGQYLYLVACVCELHGFPGVWASTKLFYGSEAPKKLFKRMLSTPLTSLTFSLTFTVLLFYFLKITSKNLHLMVHFSDLL